MSTGPRPSFSPSAQGYPLHHQHSSEHKLSQRPTTSHTLAAPSPVTRAVITIITNVNCRIAIATSTMSKLSSIWTSSRLSLAIEIRHYNSLMISIITYSSVSWTLTKAQMKRLDAFNTNALCPIVGVCWYDYVTNTSILIRTPQPPLTTMSNPQTTRAFGHIYAICNPVTRHPSYRHSGLHPTFIMAPPKRMPTTPPGRPNHQRYPDVPE